MGLQTNLKQGKQEHMCQACGLVLDTRAILIEHANAMHPIDPDPMNIKKRLKEFGTPWFK